MKLSVCGKGGAGRRSAIVTLLANELKARGYRVLMVDSDESNTGKCPERGYSGKLDSQW